MYMESCIYTVPYRFNYRLGTQVGQICKNSGIIDPGNIGKVSGRTEFCRKGKYKA